MEWNAAGGALIGDPDPREQLTIVELTPEQLADLIAYLQAL
jgi:hypothetical protein